MKKPNITEGEWTFTKQDGTPGHCMMAQVFDTTEDEKYIASIRPTEPWSIANANAKAISAVPEMIDALIEAEKQLLEYFHEEHLAENNEAYQKIKQALIKAGCTE